MTAVCAVVALLVVVAGCDKGSGGAGQFLSGPDGGPPETAPPESTPIHAVFSPLSYSTAYSVTVTNADSDHVTLSWSGPNCGMSGPTSATTCDDKQCAASFGWTHAHPPCDPTTQHKDVTIVFTAVGQKSGSGVMCTYQGADSGDGPACVGLGFDDSVIGPDNTAHVVYQVPPARRCSKVQSIQVMHLVTKGANPSTAIPHSVGMIDPGANMAGYSLPADADDVNGYVVDKFQNSVTTNDPYYAGSEPGTQSTPAVLDDKPGNTKPGYTSIFEVCTFCSEKAGDADFGKILDCFTWELDGDSQKASRTSPQPTEKPSQGFTNAVNAWDKNHAFTMPK